MSMLYEQLDDFSIDDLCGYNNSIFDQNFWDAEEQKVCVISLPNSCIPYLILWYFVICNLLPVILLLHDSCEVVIQWS